MKEPNFSSQTDSQTDRQREPNRQNNPRAAVIRPLRAVDGSSHSDDAEQASQRPQLQTQQLNEYVRWLQKQAVENLNQIELQPKPSSRSNPNPDLEQGETSTGPQTAKANTSEKTNREQWTFIHTQAADVILGSKSQLGFQTTVNPAKPPVAPTAATRPILELVSPDQTDRAERPKFRVDPPHVQLGDNRAPAPKQPATGYQVDADLLRILKKLDTVNQPSSDSSRPDTSRWSQDPMAANAERIAGKNQPIVFQPSPADSHDEFRPIELDPAARRVGQVAPLEFLRNSDSGWNSVIDRQMSQTISEAPAAEQLSKREIIETVSKAIASVLTDQSEAVIEKKVRERLDQLQKEWSSQHHFAQTPTPPAPPASHPISGWESETNTGSPATPQSSRTPGGSGPQPQSSNSCQIPSTAGNSQPRSSEKPTGIPVEVAAWDVNDFRWPTISTQMITIGAKAIDALYRSLLNNVQRNSNLGPTRRIGISAPNRQAGTTSIAISLARWAVEEGRRVLLIDADLQNPALSSETGLGSSISWGRLSLDRPLSLSLIAESIIRSQQSQLCVMPLGTDGVPGNSSRLPLDFLASLVDQVAEHFDLILIDAGPADQIFQQISQPGMLLDSVLLVHQHRNLQLDEIQNQFRKRGIQKLVLAQNAAQSNVASQVA
jgi:Mrp family chromosome partitioning ATPase